MSTLRTTLRRFGAAITLASGVLLVAAFWVVGSHHHDDGSIHHHCAVCSTVSTHAAPAHDAPRLAPAPERHAHEPLAPRALVTRDVAETRRARAPPPTA
jgi:hypothetical protein